tara:strand:+ start:13115 stop:13969 length:855 start_codon:yes stop_codon:yes gene_type:complete
MKKILTILLIVFAFSAYSQTTIDYVYKRQPIKFSKIALADTMFLSSESPYGTYGNLFVIDSTLDGRYFINDGYALVDSLTQIRSELTDSIAQIRVELADSTAQLRLDISDSLSLNISDTATQIRSELTDSIAQLRSDISDTAFWKSNEGTYLTIKADVNDSILIGSINRDFNSVLQVGGQFNQNISGIDVSSTDTYNAKSGNVLFLFGTGNFSQIVNCADGTRILATATTGTSIIINPSNWATNGQTLRTLSGLPIMLTDYDVIEILCIAANEFVVISTSGDNQ